MSTCANCNKKLSCGCQRRTASNGKSVCSSCVSTYEKSFTPASATNTTEKPELNAWGKDRYKHLKKFIKQ